MTPVHLGLVLTIARPPMTNQIKPGMVDLDKDRMKDWLKIGAVAVVIWYLIGTLPFLEWW